MRYFIIALIIIAATFGIHTLIVNSSPDRSVESGLERNGSVDETRQAQEDDKSIWDTQRQNRNHVPRD